MLKGMGPYLIRSKILERSEVKGGGAGSDIQGWTSSREGGWWRDLLAPVKEGALRCFLMPSCPRRRSPVSGSTGVARQWDVPMGNSNGIYEKCYGPKG